MPKSNILMQNTHTHTFNGLFSRTTWVSRHQKGKPFWILLKQEIMGWKWHQRDHMQIICTTLQTDNHASTPSLIFYGPDALPDAKPTVSKHWRQNPNAETHHITYKSSSCSTRQVWPLQMTNKPKKTKKEQWCGKLDNHSSHQYLQTEIKYFRQ